MVGIPASLYLFDIAISIARLAPLLPVELVTLFQLFLCQFEWYDLNRYRWAYPLHPAMLIPAVVQCRKSEWPKGVVAKFKGWPFLFHLQIEGITRWSSAIYFAFVRKCSASLRDTTYRPPWGALNQHLIPSLLFIVPNVPWLV